MLQLPLIALSLLAPVSASGDATVLSALPDEAAMVVYSPSLGAASAALFESPWLRYFAEGPGRETVDSLLQLQLSLSDDGRAALSRLESVRDFLLAHEGEGLVYLERAGLGVVLAGGAAAPRDASLDPLMATLSSDWEVEFRDQQGARVELWRTEAGGPSRMARVRGAAASGLYFAEDVEAALAGVTGLLERLDGEAESRAASRIAGRLHGRAPRVVLDLDLARLASWLSEEEPESAPLLEELGLAEENHVLVDAHQSPSGLHQLTRWSFGAQTGIGRMMDSFQPIEMSQVATLPAGTVQFSLLRWQPMQLLGALFEVAPAEVALQWQELRQASASLLGFDVESDLLAELDGRFSTYAAPGLVGQPAALDPLGGWSFQIGLHDGARLEGVLLDLLEAGAERGLLELDSFEEYDVWELQGELASSAPAMRLVFTPGALLLVNGREDLASALAPFGPASATLADGAAQVEELRARSGAFFFSYQDQAAAAATVLAELEALRALLGMSAQADQTELQLGEWFPGTLTTSAERTEEGVLVKSSIR